MLEVKVGVDLIEVKRLQPMQKNVSFLKKIFTQQEINYCLTKKNVAQHLAVRYAAKEAVVKALSGWKENISYKDIEVIKRNSIPSICLHTKNKDAYTIELGLSHTATYALAFVFIYRQKVEQPWKKRTSKQK